MLVGHQPDPQLADDGAKVVRAGTAHRDRPHDHQLTQARCIGKFGNAWRFVETAFEHLIEVHLGHTAGCAPGVVVIFHINHQAFQHALHLV